LFFLCQFVAFIENHGSGSEVVLYSSENCWSRVHDTFLPSPVGSFFQKTVNHTALVLTNTSIAQQLFEFTKNHQFWFYNDFRMREPWIPVFEKR
jgi:hypothetical protein